MYEYDDVLHIDNEYRIEKNSCPGSENSKNKLKR